MTTSDPLLSPERFAEASSESHWKDRSRQIARFTHRYCQEHFTDEGVWKSDRTEPDTRKTLWLCFGLFGKESPPDAITLGNAIIEDLVYRPHNPTRSPEEAASEFDIFISNHAVQMLVLFEEQFSKSARTKIEKWARLALGELPGDRQADYQFHGANDNMPSKATLGLILGGEYFNDERAVAHGLWNLHQLANLLTRRGVLSEYTSPTYLPLTLLNLAEVAEHARDPEAARLAELCTQRIWSDILGHYHWPTRTVGGPYSRSYHQDSTGHFSTLNSLLWLAFGDDHAPFNPLDELSRQPVRLFHQHTDVTTQIGVLAWLTACQTLPEKSLRDWAFQRSFPYRFEADAERIGRGASDIHLTVYSEEDFSLGTSLGEAWTALQSEAFFLNYRRRAPFRDISDLRVVFARYITNDKEPPRRGEGGLLSPESSLHVLQKDRVALLLTRPEKRLAGQALNSLKFSFILPTHFGEPDRIELIPGKLGTRCADHIVIQDGPLYIALRGLNGTHWERSEGPMTDVETVHSGEYLMASFFNYRGAERVFSEEEIERTANGAAVVLGCVAEESFESFRDRVLAAELLDYSVFGQRTTTYRMEDTELSASFAASTNRFRYTSIDGRTPTFPRWKADGMPESDLPFLSGPPSGIDISGFPYHHLKVVWDLDHPWDIFSSPNTPDDRGSVP